MVFRSAKKKNDSKSISALNVRGDFHIHIAMQHVILSKYFKSTHPPENSNDVLSGRNEYLFLPIQTEIYFFLQKPLVLK